MRLREDKEAWDTFTEMVNNLVVNERSLFVTSEGGIGCCDRDVEVGDAFVFVAGVPAPLVLRARDPNGDSGDRGDGEYEVVGAAFVPGWMGGEVECGGMRDIRLV